MTVFKGYLKILKKNLGMLLIYLVIFFAIAIALQASARKEHLGTFKKTRINVAVADRDQSELSRGLIRYLSTIHNVSEISSEPSVMQEELLHLISCRSRKIFTRHVLKRKNLSPSPKSLVLIPLFT